MLVRTGQVDGGGCRTYREPVAKQSGGRSEKREAKTKREKNKRAGKSTSVVRRSLPCLSFSPRQSPLPRIGLVRAQMERRVSKTRAESWEKGQKARWLWCDSEVLAGGSQYTAEYTVALGEGRGRGRREAYLDGESKGSGGSSWVAVKQPRAVGSALLPLTASQRVMRTSSRLIKVERRGEGQPQPASSHSLSCWRQVETATEIYRDSHSHPSNSHILPLPPSISPSPPQTTRLYSMNKRRDSR